MTITEFNHCFQSNATYFQCFAQKLTKNVADAKDLVQDACIRAINKRDSFSDLPKFRNWFSTIIYNTFINKFRRKSRRQELLAKQANTRGLFFNRRTEANQGYEVLKCADIKSLMQSISENNLEAFRLYEEGYSYQEISDIQDIPIGTVKSRIFFVRNRMKSLLEEENLLPAA